MKRIRIFTPLLIVSILIGCGGDDAKKTTTGGSSTDGSSKVVSTLSISNSKPGNGNGVLQITDVSSDAPASGGDQVVKISGTAGDKNDVKHLIEIHYYLYYVGADTFAQITHISDAWGSMLDGAVDGGIAVCDADCTSTTIDKTSNTIVFSGQQLTNTASLSTISGTILYPDAN